MIRGRLETFADGRYCESSRIRSRNASLAIPRVRFLQKRSNRRRENAHRGGIVPLFGQDLDGGEVVDVYFLLRFRRRPLRQVTFWLRGRRPLPP
jgi:hypothetical protein